MNNINHVLIQKELEISQEFLFERNELTINRFLNHNWLTQMSHKQIIDLLMIGSFLECDVHGIINDAKIQEYGLHETRASTRDCFVLFSQVFRGNELYKPLSNDWFFECGERYEDFLSWLADLLVYWDITIDNLMEELRDG